MSEIPSNLEIFDCGGGNDFGELVWEASLYEEYKLQCIDLSNARIYAQLSMQFFDNENGGYPYLEYVDLSFNPNCNISIDFEHLDGQANLLFLNFLYTKAYVNSDKNSKFA